MDWKLSDGIPIPKHSDPSNVSNYHLISLLPLISKALERIVHNHVMQSLLSDDLQSNIQFGFRPCSSMHEALLTVVNDWHNQLASHRQVAVFFFDIWKTFDLVSHDPFDFLLSLNRYLQAIATVVHGLPVKKAPTSGSRWHRFWLHPSHIISNVENFWC